MVEIIKKPVDGANVFLSKKIQGMKFMQKRAHTFSSLAQNKPNIQKLLQQKKSSHMIKQSNRTPLFLVQIDWTSGDAQQAIPVLTSDSQSASSKRSYGAMPIQQEISNMPDSLSCGEARLESSVSYIQTENENSKNSSDLLNYDQMMSELDSLLQRKQKDTNK